MGPKNKKCRLFIAQPPLFRSKKGNSIQYLKNQNEMEDYLIEEGIKKLTYEVPKNNNLKHQISNLELINLLKLMHHTLAHISMLEIELQLLLDYLKQMIIYFLLIIW